MHYRIERMGSIHGVTHWHVAVSYRGAMITRRVTGTRAEIWPVVRAWAALLFNVWA